ncbi:N-lysine methyltransferase kmt5a [Bulinus truncatus]|nr:N-lysine methyltransferase kmt5a [Bulinus truncatus]
MMHHAIHSLAYRGWSKRCTMPFIHSRGWSKRCTMPFIHSRGWRMDKTTMKNHANDLKHAFNTPKKSTKGSSKTKKEKNIPSSLLTPDSSPCSGEETETVVISKAEEPSQDGYEKEMKQEALSDEPAAESICTVAAVPLADDPPAHLDTVSNHTVESGSLLTNCEGEGATRRQICKSPPRVENKLEGQGELGTQVVSPSVPKQKVRRKAIKPVTGSLEGKPKTTRKKKAPEPIQKNTITNYYPVRRSGRQTKSEIECAKQHQLEQQILNHCQDGLQMTDIEDKGRGVVATKKFCKGDFVVEYAGELIDMETARVREETYADNPKVGCYMYYFQCASKQYCIDATSESKYFGRLVNHSREGNCCTKAVMINNKPYLYLLASRDIEPGEELCYDYGDRRKEALAQHPWLKL